MRKHAPATLRNRMAIADVLRAVLPRSGIVLEVASGSGEHAAYFAGEFPALDWQPSDPDPSARALIAAWCAGLANVLRPLALDAAADDWPVARADAVLCINMAHISPWAATLGLLAGAARVLTPDAPLILYGPFRQAGVPLADGNAAFAPRTRSGLGAACGRGRRRRSDRLRARERRCDARRQPDPGVPPPLDRARLQRLGLPPDMLARSARRRTLRSPRPAVPPDRDWIMRAFTT